MFAGRSSASKTHVLLKLFCCLYLIILDIDHVTSMSLDKLVVEHNEIGQDLVQSVENSAKTENSDEYIMLPGSQEEFERNTIEDNGGVAAEEDAFDMLMMETNEAPMIQVVQLPAGVSNEAETQNVQTAESLVANEDKIVTSTPIALVLADLAQQQTATEVEKAVEVEKTAAELKKDAAEVVNNVQVVVAKEQAAQTTSNEEDSESESVAEMILEAVETMQQALESSNKINADIAVQEEELEKEAENELLGNVIQNEFAEVVKAQNNESKEPLTEQLENQVVADVGETVAEDLATTIDDIPSEEYVDAEAGGAMNAVIEALVDNSVEDQEVAESENDSVTEAVVENIVPGNLVSNKLFIEEPSHNTVHEEVKPLEETQKTKTEHSEVSELEPEEAEALIVHDEEIDAEETGEETLESMLKNEDEEVEKVLLENQKEVAQAIAEKIEQAQVEVSGESEVNQAITQRQEENLVVAENSEQVQASEESQAAIENEAQVQEEHQKLPVEVDIQEESQAVDENQEQAQNQEETEVTEEKLEQSEVQTATHAAEENKEQAQVQDGTQAVEETQDSEETPVVEEKLEHIETQGVAENKQPTQFQDNTQSQVQAQESHESLEKLEQVEVQAENQAVDENQAQDESQSQEELVEVPEQIQAVSETVPEQVQNQAQTQKDSQEGQTEDQQEKLELTEVQEEQVQAAQEEIQEQALTQEINHENAEIQSEKITENTKVEEELNNEEQPVKKENELPTRLVELSGEKEPEEQPQKAEEQSVEIKNEENEEKLQEQLNVEKEKEETVNVKEENEDKQKLEDEVPKVELPHEEEEVQEINEETTEIKNEEEENINEPTIELEQVEELEHNVEKQIEEVEKLDESTEEAHQAAEETIEEQNEQKENKKEAQQETEQEVTHNEAEQTVEEQPENHKEQEEPQKEAEQTIEEHNDSQKEQKEVEKESIQEQEQKLEPNVDNLQEVQQHQEELQNVQADTIQEEPQTVVQHEDEPLLIDQNLEEQEISQDVYEDSHLEQAESGVNQVVEEILPLSDIVIVPQDPVAALQEVNDNEEASNAEIFNHVTEHVEAESTHELAMEQDEASSEAIVAQTTDEQTQKVQEQEPVQIEEEVVQETVAETEKETEIEAKPVEAAETTESAQIDVQSISNTIAPEQPGDVAQVDVDKTQNVEEPQQIDNQSSMLTTIVQVPAIQQPQQLAVQPVQAVAVEEVATKVETAAEEQQPMPISSMNNTLTGPLNVMDSVLNYVNASFITNNNDNNKKNQPISDDEFSSQLRRYDGAQVWRIVVQNDRDKKLVDELQTKYDAQLWKEVKAEVDYLLKPQVLADAEKHIRRANLSRIVLIDNLQKVIEVENPPAEEIAQLQNRKGHRMTWQAYHRLQDIHGFFDYLAKTYPDICSVETIGYSIEKRALKILKISNGNAANPGIWMDGGMHAREWISPASVTFIANQLVEGWDDLPAYMRNVNWYIHAVANPDGYEYSHTTDRLWRKNMRSHGRQCPGVDLNRNFGYKWGGKGTSANPCSMTYRGSKAFSEPETFYISKFISNFPRETFQAYLSFHSYGQYILYPWGYDYLHSSDRAELDLVARQAGTTITRSSGVKYTVGASATTLYPAAGGSDDWAKGIAGIKYAYTIEMGDTGRYGFVLPASMIENNGKNGFTFVETVARAVTHQDQDIRRRALYKRYSLKSF